MEIDSDNNLERFKTGSGAEEAVEIHDFGIVSELVLVLSYRVGSAETFFCMFRKRKEKKNSCQCKHGMSVIWCRELQEFASLEVTSVTSNPKSKPIFRTWELTTKSR